ncbi:MULTISPECIES: MFS transporter [Flavobacterium]|uniref:MFS transporter n=1 Tax=Flavobacterium TaxID=237 RepID=UPI001FCC5C39|nr:MULTISPECIES: MFS transporter [Flavobacterium]UOK43219.1 MFS transporter [Flavobacterium enshiense]
MVKIKKGSVFILIGLYVLTIPFFNTLNITAYDNSQILGHFGESTTAFTYSSYIPVFAMLAFLPLGIRIAKQLPLRTMVLSVSFLAILFNTASLYTTSIGWFTVWRSLLSIISIVGIFATMIPIILKYNPAFNMAIMYGIMQFILQGSQHIYKYLGTSFTSLHDWTFSVYFLNANFFIGIILAWIFYRKDIAPMKGVFQFDWRGWFLMILLFTDILFLCAEGQTRNWFQDPKIASAVAFGLIIIGVYILHTRFTEDPLIDPDVFKYSNVAIGSFLFFYIGAINGTGSVVSGFMGNVLGFDPLYEARTHLSMLIGIFIAIPLTTYLLYKKIYIGTVWIMGFTCYGLYHMILFFRFYPEISPSDFMEPFVIKGLAIGFLYPTSSLYLAEGIPKKLGDSRMMSGVICRVVLAVLLGSAILGTMISNANIHHKTGLSQQLSPTNQLAEDQLIQTKNVYLHKGLSETEAQKMAEKSLSNQTSQAAILLAYKDVYLVLSAICFLPVLIILLFRLGRRPLGRVEVEPIPI